MTQVICGEENPIHHENTKINQKHITVICGICVCLSFHMFSYIAKLYTMSIDISTIKALFPENHHFAHSLSHTKTSTTHILYVYNICFIIFSIFPSRLVHHFPSPPPPSHPLYIPTIWRPNQTRICSTNRQSSQTHIYIYT